MPNPTPFKLSLSDRMPTEDEIFKLSQKVYAVLDGNDQLAAIFALQDAIASIVVQSAPCEAAATIDLANVHRGMMVVVQNYYSRPAGLAN